MANRVKSKTVTLRDKFLDREVIVFAGGDNGEDVEGTVTEIETGGIVVVDIGDEEVEFDSEQFLIQLKDETDNVEEESEEEIESNELEDEPEDEEEEITEELIRSINDKGALKARIKEYRTSNKDAKITHDTYRSVEKMRDWLIDHLVETDTEEEPEPEEKPKRRAVSRKKDKFAPVETGNKEKTKEKPVKKKRVSKTRFIAKKIISGIHDKNELAKLCSKEFGGLPEDHKTTVYIIHGEAKNFEIIK